MLELAIVISVAHIAAAIALLNGITTTWAGQNLRAGD